jgi:hypothetical protein
VRAIREIADSFPQESFPYDGPLPAGCSARRHCPACATRRFRFQRYRGRALTWRRRLCQRRRGHWARITRPGAFANSCGSTARVTARRTECACGVTDSRCGVVCVGGRAQESAIGAGYSVEDEHGLRLQDDACEVRPRLNARCRNIEERVARCLLCKRLGSGLRLEHPGASRVTRETKVVTLRARSQGKTQPAA